ncbi:MAG: CHASE4 domain-containing protein [Ignavibacteria bacterium]|nr:CHASE4 domain-containing protein [Ignavibacteria bacterium]
MKHRIVYRITFVIGILIILFLFGINKLRENQQEYSLSLSKEGKKRTETLLKNNIDLLSQNILSYTFDYTYWDEMVKFVEKRDLTWAEVNIVATLPNFKINCVWVLDNRFKQFYSYNTLEEKRHDQFPINSETVKEIFLKEKFPHFFLKSGQHLFEIAGAPIQYSADLERKGVPKGYFFTARIWDKKYLDAIGKNNFTTISLYEPSEYSKI